MYRVGIIGALGKMGQDAVHAILNANDMDLVMAVHHTHEGVLLRDKIEGLPPDCMLTLHSNLQHALESTSPDVVIELTRPEHVDAHATAILSASAHALIGTTGLSHMQLDALDRLAHQQGKGILVAPNFAIGAVLLMKFAQEASRYFEHAEIIEYHHNQKLDAPSGTALRTAQLMQEARAEFGLQNVADTEILAGARGAAVAHELRIHSVRLPGLVAHEEVIFGGVGQTLTIRHDSLSRQSFMPGILYAVRHLPSKTGLYHGLETLLEQTSF
jgi:4-hydroxy-tetrahydrodipicolinate reductase